MTDLAYFPDAPESTPGLLVSVQAIPTTRGYGGAPSAVSAGFAALAAACTGAALLARLDGTVRQIAGTQTKLYEGSGGVWTDVSRVGNYVTGDVKWRFAQFGNTTLAISKAIQLQFSNSGAFANVSNSPKAALMESVGPFIILANCDDTGTGLATGFGDQPNRWWTSPSFAPTTSWTPATSTSCASGLLVSAPGEITALKRLGDTCIAFKDRAMYVGQLTGGPDVIRWDLVPGEIGTANNEAVVSIGPLLYFIGSDDIYSFDGSRPVSVGQGIKETFFAELNKAYAYKIEGQHDFQKQCIWWHFPSGSSTTLNDVIVFNYVTGKWGRTLLDVECAVPAVTSQITFDTLGNFFATFDDLPATAYDSPFWQAGAPVMSVIDTTHTLQTLTGASSNFRVKTGYVGDDQQVSTCIRVLPRWGIKPLTATITPRTVMALGDTEVTGSTWPINGNRFDVLQSARYHGFEIACTGEVELQLLTPTLVGDGDE